MPNDSTGTAPTHRTATTRITYRTPACGEDDPNCFSLAVDDGDWSAVRIVNMHLGAFERVRHARLCDGAVRVRMVSETLGVIDDPRVPAEDLTSHWCAVCCSFLLLPVDQQRDHLRWNVPRFDAEGRLMGWYRDFRPGTEPHPDEQIDAWLAQIIAAQVARNPEP